MDLEALVRGLADQDQLVDLIRLPARPASRADLDGPLPAPAAALIPGGGLWAHQARAVDEIRSGRSVALATGTASGKSLCYQIAIADAVAGGGPDPATALLLFPTKALAHDQLRSFGDLGVPGLVAAAYDGDTLPDERARIRRTANVVLTNPDMLHASVLPGHERWATFLLRLRFVVVDELHTLRGVHGSHVAHLLRRLRRLCARYGSDPSFVFTSATIGNPGPLAEALCGRPVVEVTDDGSRRGEQLVALWNPPLLDRGSGRRRSAHAESARLLAALAGAGRRTIAFTRSRRAAELVAGLAREQMPAEHRHAIRSYRGGYLARERRAIEEDLAQGRLLGVAATSALELGIDIGGLDACVIDGYPGTIASLRQQAGRAGRSGGPSLVVLVAGPDALDQWVVNHPAEAFGRPPEPAVVNPSNPFVVDNHLACAAYEQPLEPGDHRWWGPDLEDGIRRLVVADRLRLREGRAVHNGDGPPALQYGLRTDDGPVVSIVDTDGTLIGTVGGRAAPRTVHPGAVYLHQGQAFRVLDLDLDSGVAVVEPAPGDELTQARSSTTVTVLGTDRSVRIGAVVAGVGPVEVTERVVGYRHTDLRTGAVLAETRLDLPARTLTTRALWFAFPDPPAPVAGDRRRLLAALHAVEHAAVGLLPLFALCDPWDVAGLTALDPAAAGGLEGPAVMIYDSYPGGAGICDLAFASAAEHLAAAASAVAGCPCDRGCPSCVQSPRCGSLNEPLSKTGAAALLVTADPSGSNRDLTCASLRHG